LACPRCNCQLPSDSKSASAGTIASTAHVGGLKFQRVIGTATRRPESGLAICELIDVYIRFALILKQKEFLSIIRCLGCIKPIAGSVQTRIGL
jgi:hypothetical protein